MQIKAVCGILPGMNETPFKIIFWTNETNIYTATWRSRCCQLHRLARLNTSAWRYISWRQIWYICLTVVIFWICLRFRNVEMKYLKKAGICTPKYTASHWTYSTLVNIFSVYFFIEISLLLRFFWLLVCILVFVNKTKFVKVF